MNDIALPQGPAKPSHDWPIFAQCLAEVLAALQEDQFLILNMKHSERFLQFAAQGSFGTRAEISSNAYLPRSERLSKGLQAQLKGVGWLPPTGSPSASTPEHDPDGSPNFFIQFPATATADAIVEQAVSALAGILRVPHPGFLEYEAFDATGDALVFAELGIKRRDRRGESRRPDLSKRLLAAIREITGLNNLEYDADGDIAVRCGSIVTYICLVGDPAYVRLFAPLVLEIRETPELLVRLNEINAGSGHMHCFVHDETIFARAEFPAAPLHCAHLETELRRFCEVSDGIDDLLAAEFDGRTVYSTNMQSASLH